MSVNNQDKSGGFSERPRKLGKLLAIAAAVHLTALYEPIAYQVEETAQDVWGVIDPTYGQLRKLKELRPKDPIAEKKFKEELIKELESGKDISLKKFTFQSEKVSQGMRDPEINSAQKSLYEDLEELEKEKPLVPTKDFLERIVSKGISSDEKVNDYARSLTSVTRFLNRKGQVRRGNCEARALTFAIMLEELYPERKKDINFQIFGDNGDENDGHIRTVITVPEIGKTYVLEPGTEEVTDENKMGTAIYSVKDHIAQYAGDPRFIREIQVEGEQVNNENTKIFKNPFATRSTETIFNNVKINGSLRPYSTNGEEQQENYKKEKDLLEEDIVKEKASIEAALQEEKRPVELELWQPNIANENIKYTFDVGPKKWSHAEAQNQVFNLVVTRQNYLTLENIAEFERQMKDAKFRTTIEIEGDMATIGTPILQALLRLPSYGLILSKDHLFGNEMDLPDSFLEGVNQYVGPEFLILDLRSKNGRVNLSSKALKNLMRGEKEKSHVVFKNLALNVDKVDDLLVSPSKFLNIDLLSEELYSDEVLKALDNKSKTIIFITVPSSRKENFEKYRQQSPWLKETKNNGRPRLWGRAIVISVR